MNKSRRNFLKNTLITSAVILFPLTANAYDIVPTDTIQSTEEIIAAIKRELSTNLSTFIFEPNDTKTSTAIEYSFSNILDKYISNRSIYRYFVNVYRTPAMQESELHVNVFLTVTKTRQYYNLKFVMNSSI